MKLPKWMHHRLISWSMVKIGTPPDFIVGKDHPEGPYMLRWYVIPRNRWFNIYLHLFLRSDEDEALHDHPWMNCSMLLRGSYIEHTIAAGGVHRRQTFSGGDIKLRLSGKSAHRIELFTRQGRMSYDGVTTHPEFGNQGEARPAAGRVLVPHPPGQGFTGGGVWKDQPVLLRCTTLFLTGPMYREWGFHCPNGWRRFSEFAKLKAGTSDRGKGCAD